MFVPTKVSAQVSNSGLYDGLLYRYWGYPYHARNSKEDKEAAFRLTGNPDIPVKHGAGQPSGLFSKRLIEPIYLCFLTDHGTPSKTVTWKEKHQGTPEYIFVSYTSEQFPTSKEQLLLHGIGEHAARAAGVPAYWVGCSCLGEDDELEENVFRISDIIRGAHSLVIAVSQPYNTTYGNPAVDTLLGQWGKRVWTLPEILLSPSDRSILVYSREEGTAHPIELQETNFAVCRELHKRNFADIWEDAPISRELLDHFEGTLILTQLELQIIALSCFYNRQKGYYLPGDMAYALMGLLRRRPTVVRCDSAFQAFARLSLANDSNLLLERLLCVLPKSHDQDWYCMEDQWGVSLWDIYPTTQICGIGESDTIILDGAFAASIRWQSFAPVATLVNDSWRRFFARLAFRSTSYILIIGALILATSSQVVGLSFLTFVGTIFLIVSLTQILLAPYIIRILYSGKLRDTQPWFFGFEGYMPISTIERHIFGADMHRLRWSTAGSPLSVHCANEYGECVGQDPTVVPQTAERVRRAVGAPMGEEKIFTLVDTHTLSVTMFAAKRPPVAVVLCGNEGGMQRAMLCSYDWSSQTLYRESVLRMETPARDKMSRVGKLRFGFRRHGKYS
ncbi:MAG: hypothetical protein Q9163_001561 [Psora crenata]